MQRSSSAVSRNLVIGSVVVSLLFALLYFLKRVEVNHLKHDLDVLGTQHSQREDELNGKLTEYLQKLEDMTRQLGDVNSRLQECEDNKATVLVEIQKCKNVNTECSTSKEAVEKELKVAQTELTKLKAQHNTANSQLANHQQSLANAQQALHSAESELQTCEDQKDACNDAKQKEHTLLEECKRKEATCQQNLASAGSMRAFQATHHQGAGLPQGGFPNQRNLQAQGARGGGAPLGEQQQQQQQQGLPQNELRRQLRHSPNNPSPGVHNQPSNVNELQQQQEPDPLGVMADNEHDTNGVHNILSKLNKSHEKGRRAGHGAEDAEEGRHEDARDNDEPEGEDPKQVGVREEQEQIQDAIKALGIHAGDDEDGEHPDNHHHDENLHNSVSENAPKGHHPEV